MGFVLRDLRIRTVSTAARGERMNLTSQSKTAMSQWTEMSTSSTSSSASSEPGLFGRARNRSKYFMCLR